MLEHSSNDDGRRWYRGASSAAPELDNGARSRGNRGRQRVRTHHYHRCKLDRVLFLRSRFMQHPSASCSREIQYGAAGIQGYREYMEDRYDWSVTGSEHGYQLFGMFDGHGGDVRVRSPTCSPLSYSRHLCGSFTHILHFVGVLPVFTARELMACRRCSPFAREHQTFANCTCFEQCGASSRRVMQ